ncbi:death-inducer obliterator 1-like [Neophocaena asiaeorientalis asiaeorientalis]|uniref:Death-inducer obliterator 1-like n=1 Tax=Neophocaena asiaeorientalis asiaeorientalis TaxID=1706337 RepID=A0A341BW79_NEOAA|nr:death-inducer obliterator 1-like [Neophocaena asiaeorientalis asiaeorientalis]
MDPVHPRVPAALLPEKKPPKYPLCPGDAAILSSLKPGATNTVTASPASVTVAASSVTSSSSKTASPLEHILQTLFGKKKAFDPPTKEPAESAPAPHQDSRAKAGGGLPAAPLLDPIVQQFGQFSKDRALEEEEDDRPYDPEEEYGPERAFDTQLGDRGRRQDAEKAAEAAEREEVAYDPEDETILEEAKVTVDDLPTRMCVDAHGGPGLPAPSLAEQQQMIEELTKQIEEQQRQVEEQEEALRQQRAAVGASMAHFSVSDALMSPPPKAGPGPLPAQEEPESAPPPWAPGEEAPPPAKQDGPLREPVESPGPEGAAGGDGVARPARKVLLPTPPGASFQPLFPSQHEGQTFHPPGGRDPFSGPGYSQEKPLGSCQYEDQRNAQFPEKSDSLAAETEGDREPQPRPGEGAGTFPAAAQKGGPPPQFQGQREPAPRAFGMSGLHGPNYTGPRGPVPPFSEENSNNDGPRGGPPPARFGPQKGPIPSLFSGPHGPPPYGDGRGPSPSHLGGPRGAGPPPFEDRKDPHGEKREFPEAPYGEASGPPGQCEGPEQAPFLGNRGAAPFQFGGQRRPLLSQFKGPRGGPPPSQFGGQRGPPAGHFVGPRGPHPGQFEGPRGQAPGFVPGPRGMQPQQFEEQRVHSPPRFTGQRAPAPLPFGGPRGAAPFPEKSESAPPRFHFQGPAAPGPQQQGPRAGAPQGP